VNSRFLSSTRATARQWLQRAPATRELRAEKSGQPQMPDRHGRMTTRSPRGRWWPAGPDLRCLQLADHPAVVLKGFERLSGQITRHGRHSQVEWLRSKRSFSASCTASAAGHWGQYQPSDPMTTQLVDLLAQCCHSVAMADDPFCRAPLLDLLT
jgi:hypothetical protein